MADSPIVVTDHVRKPRRRTRRGEPMRWLTAHITYSGDDCLTWPFSGKSDGYGQLAFRGKLCVASRVMAIMALGEPPTPEHHAAHTCNNGHLGCVNPRHLQWKTCSENQRDKIAAGTACRGERHFRAILTETKVSEIKSKLRAGSRRSSVAREYGVHWMTIDDIRRGVTWGWVA